MHVFTVASEPVTETRLIAGEVRAADRAALSFMTDGRLAAILVETGEAVAAGQLLAHLDPTPLRPRHEGAAADRDRAAAS